MNKLLILSGLCLISTLQVVSAVKCPEGFVGKDCSIECGKVFNNSNIDDTRIVGGIEAAKHSWPASILLTFNYQTSFALHNGVVLDDSFSSSCGGTIIDESHVLSAAHCLPKKRTFYYQGVRYEYNIKPNQRYPTLESMFSIYVGIHYRSERSTNPYSKKTVKKVTLHEKYDADTFSNDIALFQLDSDLVLNEKVQVSCLPSKTSENYPGYNIFGYTAGWGTTSFGGSVSEELRNVKLTVYDNSYCSRLYNNFEFSSQICSGDISGGKDTCQGDSGGSLYTKDIINGKNKFVTSGIVSYGKGCGEIGYPGIYTRVSHYLDWIEKNKNGSSNSHKVNLLISLFLPLAAVFLTKL